MVNCNERPDVGFQWRPVVINMNKRTQLEIQFCVICPLPDCDDRHVDCRVRAALGLEAAKPQSREALQREAGRQMCRDYYRRNAAAILEKKRRWYAENREQIAAVRREKNAERCRRWYRKHRKEVLRKKKAARQGVEL